MDKMLDNLSPENRRKMAKFFIREYKEEIKRLKNKIGKLKKDIRELEDIDEKE